MNSGLEEVAPDVVLANGASTHLHGNIDVVAGSIHKFIKQTRKRDLLEGVRLDRGDVLSQPFVREGQWAQAWQQVLATDVPRPRQRVTVVVAPRSFGATTFALRLLAEHTDGATALVKLDADWPNAAQGRLPLEEEHAYQLDLKDPETDRPSADFLNALSGFAEDLEICRSYLVLTVAEELWDDRLTTRKGMHVVYLTEPPTAQRVVETHLNAAGHAQLVAELRSFPKARASLQGLHAVAAVRAAGTIAMTWQEHKRLQDARTSSTSSQPAPADADLSLEDRITAALSDWREHLDRLFGEVATTHDAANPSLTLEDRCLLLALSVHQSAPLPAVANTARALQQALIPKDTGNKSGFSPVQNALAGRGLRRRILDVGAAVGSHDTVLFDRPAYGRAILEYVWDNYEVMREAMLAWLVQSASSDTADPSVTALSTLVLRHGTATHLNTLGAIARDARPDLLSAVLDVAVHDEHVGRLAWDVLYRWAEQKDYAPTVISTCRRVLHDDSASASTAKRAMVRLRRIAHTTSESGLRRDVLKAFEELAGQPSGTGRLVAEVRDWQESKASPKSGSLAFMALMPLDDDGVPWLMSDNVPDIDVQRALQDLLSAQETAAEIIPYLTGWIRTCAPAPASYGRLRDQLLPALRGHNMFHAGMELMRALADVTTPQGVNVAEDFYQHLVDPRLQPVFSIVKAPA
ncbi:hypothetical protein N4G69_47310 [Streptomyces mirabilis]|uniref:hypothetical protein n=1 Tax=Streptomyces mirabilis TaxID=68239 RepID=UPI0021BE8030|nr:hypothetical protein [Streptomyces mirabilis]MCT9113050.1 hypothetical protein [Streptomyces mirabilis]